MFIKLELFSSQICKDENTNLGLSERFFSYYCIADILLILCSIWGRNQIKALRGIFVIFSVFFFFGFDLFDEMAQNVSNHVCDEIVRQRNAGWCTCTMAGENCSVVNHTENLVGGGGWSGCCVSPTRHLAGVVGIL